MKKLILTAVLTICMTGIAQATVTFTFDAVASPYGASNIETYMEGVHGSDMTVTDATSYSGPPLSSLTNYTGDRYITDAGDSLHSFSISFNAVQITSVSFDWAKIGDELYVEADGTIIYTKPGTSGASGSSGTLDLLALLGHSATTLTFRENVHDSDTGGIGIDNLVVTNVPEPATVCILSLGALSLIRRKK